MTSASPSVPAKHKETNISTGVWSRFTEPSKDINYDFIVGCYSIGITICGFLYGLEKLLEMYIVAAGSGNASESLREFSSALKGIYLVFVPFLPCLVWSLMVRTKWIKQYKKDVKVD